MHPRRYNNGFLFLGVLDVALLSDGEDLAVLPRERLAQSLPLANLSLGRIQLYFIQVVDEVRVGVGEAVCEVHCVVVVRKFVTELEGVVGEAGVANVLFDVVAKVGNPFAAPEPASAVAAVLVGTLGHLLGIYADFHSKIEKRIRLREVVYVELNGHALGSILHLEKEPLRVPIGVDVVLHQQVVFVVRDFLRQVEVARLEFGFEEQRLVGWVRCAIWQSPNPIICFCLQHLFMLDLLPGFVDNFGWWLLDDADDFVGVGVSRLVQLNQASDVKIVLVQEGTSLVDDAIFVVKYFGIASVDDVLDGDSVLVHFGLDFLVALVLGVLATLDAVDTHHVFLPNLVEALAHLDIQLLLESLEALDLHEVDIFQWAVDWAAPLRIQQLWQQRIGRYLLLNGVHVDQLVRRRVLRVVLEVALVVLVGSVIEVHFFDGFLGLLQLSNE